MWRIVKLALKNKINISEIILCSLQDGRVGWGGVGWVGVGWGGVGWGRVGKGRVGWGRVG